MKILIKIVAVAVILGCLVAGIPAQAQANSCQNVRLLLQAKLDFTGAPPYTGWFGSVRGFIGDKYPVSGDFHGAPDGVHGPDDYLTTSGQAAHEWGRFVLNFGGVGTFLTAADKGVFHLLPGVSPHMTYVPVPPAQAFGLYVGNAKVEPGQVSIPMPAPIPTLVIPSSGAFANASGTLSVSGYFLVNKVFPANMGIWNAEINGKLCNVNTSLLPLPLN